METIKGAAELLKYYCTMFPDSNGRLTSPFGDNRGHNGIDIGGHASGTPLLAMGNGTVLDKGYGSSAGYWINVRFDNWKVSGEKVYVRFFHLKELPKIAIGATFKKNEAIATVDSTGNSTGPHVHMEIRLVSNGKALDPLAIVLTVEDPWEEEITVDEIWMHGLAINVYGVPRSQLAALQDTITARLYSISEDYIGELNYVNVRNITHIVSAGDTVAKLCIRYYGAWNEATKYRFTRLNPQVIDLDKIYDGRTLKF